MNKLPNPIAFEWDKGNSDKNLFKYDVSNKETEEVFFDRYVKIFEDIKHSQKEKRFTALGITDKNRRLHLSFTIRNQKIRIISARDQSKKKGGYMKKDKKIKIIPRFKNEDEERDFWATHDFTDYMGSFKRVELDLFNLKPSTETISLRLPQFLLARVKQLANAQDVPYQSLMKIFLAERVKQELEK